MGITDRAELGAEASWTSANQSIYGMVDYNLLFSQIDSAKLTWSGQFADKSSLSVTADYSHSPALSLSSALTGQAVTSLSALNGLYTLSEMEALAKDRTSEVEFDRPQLVASPVGKMEYFGRCQRLLHGRDAGLWRGPCRCGKRKPSLCRNSVHGHGHLAAGRHGDPVRPGIRQFDLALVAAGWRLAGQTVRPAADQAEPQTGAAHVWQWRLGILCHGLDFSGLRLPKDTLLELEIGTRISSQPSPGFAEETNEPWITAGISKQF